MRVEVDAMGKTPYPRRLTDEEFEFSFSRVMCLCIDFVIRNNKGEILFEKRPIEPFKGFWTLPGGIWRRKEPIEVAINRLLTNELGPNVSCIEKKLLGYIHHVNDGSFRSSVSLVFDIKYQGQIRGLDADGRLKYLADFSDPNIQPYQAEFFRNNPIS